MSAANDDTPPGQTSARLARRREDDRRPRAPFWFVLGACAGSLVVSLAVPALVNRGDVVIDDGVAGGGPAASDDPRSATTDDPGGGSAQPTTGPTGPGSAVGPLPPVVGPNPTTGGGEPTSAPTGAANQPNQPNRPARPGSTEPIHIGVGVPDLGVIAALGPDYDDGDVVEQIEALIDGWRRDGRIPINGRDVQFFLREYDILGPEEKRAACKAWSRDDKVLAVFAVHSFFDAIKCLPQEERIPFVATDNVFEAWMAESHPYLFSTMPTVDSIWRNWVHFMDSKGLLEDGRIGIYYGDNPGYRDFMDGSFKQELRNLGRLDQLVAEVTTDNDATGSSQDIVAMQRFSQRNVNLAVLFVSAIGQTNFMQNAQLQAYNPLYIASDWYLTTNDTATMTFPAGQYDGSLAFSSLRFGEPNVGLPPTPAAKKCIDNYERYSGRRVSPSQGAAEWMALLQGCDAGELVLAALERAGDDLSRESLPRYLEQTNNFRLGLHANVTWSANYHAGPQLQRTLVWEAGCRCWKAQGSFAPFFVP